MARSKLTLRLWLQAAQPPRCYQHPLLLVNNTSLLQAPAWVSRPVRQRPTMLLRLPVWALLLAFPVKQPSLVVSRPVLPRPVLPRPVLPPPVLRYPQHQLQIPSWVQRPRLARAAFSYPWLSLSLALLFTHKGRIVMTGVGDLGYLYSCLSLITIITQHSCPRLYGWIGGA